MALEQQSTITEEWHDCHSKNIAKVHSSFLLSQPHLKGKHTLSAQIALRSFVANSTLSQHRDYTDSRVSMNVKVVLRTVYTNQQIDH